MSGCQDIGCLFRWMIAGTDNGTEGIVRPTGKKIMFPVVAISRVADGRIVEDWVSYSQMTMHDQLGSRVSPPEIPDKK